MYKGEWQTVRGNSMVASLHTGTGTSTPIYYALPAYDGLGPAKVSTIDTFTQFVTGDFINDGRTEDYFRNHAKGAVSFYGANLLTGTHQFKIGFDHLFGGYPHKNVDRRAGNYQLRFNAGVPFEINTFNYPVRPRNDNHYLGTVRSGRLVVLPQVDAESGRALRLRQCLCAGAVQCAIGFLRCSVLPEDSDENLALVGAAGTRIVRCVWRR